MWTPSSGIVVPNLQVSTRAGQLHSSSFGVVGLSGQNGTGVGGSGTGPNGWGGSFISSQSFGLVATSSQSDGLVASTDRPDGNFAASFLDNVLVGGSFTALGAKSAAVKRRNGTHVRMYCQEAPEPWFEDFGTAELKNGRSEVPLDPEFDEVVKGDDYRVFLTEIGDCGGLYVSRKGPHRFVVQSRAGTNASGTFDYRVVARRLDEVGKRLEKVEVPAIAEQRQRIRSRRDLESKPQRGPDPTKPEGVR
jgi:hypothetical protein